MRTGVRRRGTSYNLAVDSAAPPPVSGGPRRRDRLRGGGPAVKLVGAARLSMGMRGWTFVVTNAERPCLEME